MTGRLNFDPAEIVQQLLIDLGIGTAVADELDWPIYHDSMPDTPDDCIRVKSTEGRDNGRVQHSGEVQEHYGIQIKVRSKSAVDGFTKAHRIASTLDTVIHRNEVEVDLDLYRVNSIRRVGNVLALGKEPDSNRRNWTVNGLASIEPLDIGTGS